MYTNDQKPKTKQSYLMCFLHYYSVYKLS